MPLPPLIGRRYVLYQYRQTPGEPWRTGITTDMIWNEYGGASWDGKIGRQFVRWVPDADEAKALKFEIDKRAGDIPNIRYVKGGQETQAWEDSDLEKGLQGEGWERKYGPVETFGRSALGSSLFNWGEEAVAGAKTPFTKATFKQNLRDLEDKRKESASERPITGFLGNLTGATVGSPLPGGLGGAKAGLSYGGSLGRQVLIGTGAGLLAGAGAAEGGPMDRLKAGLKTAAAAAPLSAALGAATANFARKPTNVDPLDAGDLSWTTPSAYVTNPEALRNAGGLARISSLRASPGTLGSAAEKLGRDTPGIDSTSALIRWGRDLNDARVPGGAEKSAIAGAEFNKTAGPLREQARNAAETHPMGVAAPGAMSAREQISLAADKMLRDQGVISDPPRGFLDLGALKTPLWNLRPKPLLGVTDTAPKLERAFIDQSKRAGQDIGALESLADGRGATVDLQSFLDKIRSGPARKLDLNRARPQKLGPELMDTVKRTALPEPVDVVQFPPPPGPQTVGPIVGPKPSQTISVVPRTVPASRLNESSRMLREYAKEVGGGPMGETIHPYGKTMGSAVDESAGIASGMATTSNMSVLDPVEQAALLDAKKRFATFKTGEEAVNPMRMAAAAPNGMGSIMEGAALAGGAEAAGMNPGTIITMRQIGRMMGKQRNINPSRATNLTRMAEALEGNPQNRGWQLFGLAAKGAQHAPSTMQRGIANELGQDVSNPDSAVGNSINDSNDWFWTVVDRLTKNKGQ